MSDDDIGRADDAGASPDDFGELGDAAGGWSPPDPTGIAAVDEAVAALADLDQLPTTEHVERYEAVHRHLQDALADLDSA